MVHRAHGIGTLRIDRRFSKVLGPGAKARLQLASGTNNERLFHRINMMLDVFAERRPEILEELRDHRLTPLQAYRYFSTGEWERIPTGRHLRPLIETAKAWAKAKRRKKLSAATQRDRLAWVAMLGEYARPDATIDDLPDILERRREDAEESDHASAFNHDRSHARAFLRDTVKMTDRLYHAVVGIQPLEETPKLGKHPQTHEGARAIAARLRANAAAVWLSLCYTGMNLKEFYVDGWDIDYDLGAVRIHGQKRQRRERLVPLLVAPVVPTLKRQGFKSALRRLNADVSPHDARRSFRVWMADAGVEKVHRDFYAGHSPGTMEQLYTDPREAMALIAKWIREDRPKLLAYLGLPKTSLEVSA
jgi:hypothetical protein